MISSRINATNGQQDRGLNGPRNPSTVSASMSSRGRLKAPARIIASVAMTPEEEITTFGPSTVGASWRIRRSPKRVFAPIAALQASVGRRAVVVTRASDPHAPATQTARTNEMR